MVKATEETLDLVRQGLVELGNANHPDTGLLRVQLRRLEVEFREERDCGRGEHESQEILHLAEMVSGRLQ
ncbi:hypothetical protein SEA_YASSJOHNNY_72 [Mycobacterium phage YassJohnny]|nr:hypothetical protein SEA_YASSJOHNNY_72 [Mycobacterium phage YassJohnny]